MNKSKKIEVCIIHHIIRKDSNKNFVDGSISFPDPYRDWIYWSTWICRNTKCTSPQNQALEKSKSSKVYFLYCWDYYNKRYFTWLLEVKKVYNNHYEHKKLTNKSCPNNLIQKWELELTNSEQKELEYYFPRSNHPYIEWEWNSFIPLDWVLIWDVKYTNKEIKDITWIKDLRSWTWKGRWTEFNSINDLESWISKIKTC